MEHTIITLSNGKKVANFSSPHEFRFTDGSILPACSDEMAERLKVTFLEMTHANGDVELEFDLSQDVINHMQVWEIQHQIGAVDVVFCCLPMITAYKEIYGQLPLVKSPFRAIRVEDRIKKLISIDKQCI